MFWIWTLINVLSILSITFNIVNFDCEMIFLTG
jgi:hypothetical protein